MKIKNIIFLLIGLGVFAYILARMEVNFTEVVNSIKSPEYVVLAAIVLTGMPIIYGLRMKFIIFPIEKKKLNTFDLIIIEYIYKFILNVTPFKLNIPAKAVLLSKKCGIKLSSSASVVSFEYALDAGITIFFGFLGVISFFRDDPRISFLSIQYFILIVLACVAIFFLIPAQYFDALLTYLESFRIEIIRKIAVWTVKVLSAIRVTWVRILFDRKMYSVLVITLILLGASVFVNMLLFMGTNNYVQPIWILVVISAGLFAGGVSTIPGGLGVREATMVVLYSALGVPTEASIATVFMGRLLTLIPIIIGYFLSIRIGTETLEKKTD